MFQKRESTLRYPTFAENAPPEPFPGFAVARFDSLPSILTKTTPASAEVVLLARKGNRTLDLLITSELLYP